MNALITLSIITTTLTIALFSLSKEKNTWLSPIILPIAVIAPTFTIRPLLLILNIDTPFPEYLFDKFDTKYHLYSCLFFNAWSLTYIIGTKLKPIANNISKTLPRENKEYKTITIFITSLSITLVSTLIVATLIMKYGGIGGFIIAVKVKKSLTGLYFLKYIPVLGSIFCSYGLLNAIDFKNKKLLFLFTLLLAINYCVIMSFGERFSVATLFLALLSSLLYKKTISISTLISLLSAGLVFLFIISSIRFYLLTEGDNRKVSTLNKISSSLHLVEFDSFSLLLKEEKKLDNHFYGRDFLAGLYSVTPRFIWPERPKSVNPGAWLRNQFEPKIKNGWPITSTGEWYLNFGIIGVVLGGILSGSFAEAINKKYWNNTPSNLSIVFGAFLSIQLMYGGIRAISIQYWIYYPLAFVLITKLMNQLEHGTTQTHTHKK